jgi:hypothetical protein
MSNVIKNLTAEEYRRREMRALVAKRRWNEFVRAAAEANALGFDFTLLDRTTAKSFRLVADMAGVADGDKPTKLENCELVVTCVREY